MYNFCCKDPGSRKSVFASRSCNGNYVGAIEDPKFLRTLRGGSSSSSSSSSSLVVVTFNLAMSKFTKHQCPHKRLPTAASTYRQQQNCGRL